MINLSSLLTTVAADAMGLRRKKRKRALGFLGGSRGSFFGTSSLIGLAGLAVGAYQIFKDKTAQRGASRVEPGTTVVGDSGRVLSDFGGKGPGGKGEAGARAATPPLPGAFAGEDVVGDMPLRAVRVMIAAARCDGQLGEEELAELLSHARDAGLEAELRAEWQSPRPLAEICAGVTDPAHRRDLYVLAYSVLRADDDVTGAERVFLAQLASRLGLLPDAAAELERETARKIDQLG